MPILTANGIRIAYETAGDPKDTPLLLIMGLGMQLTAWPDDFVDGLVELGFYVIRFDNRDSGLSTKFDHAGTPSLPLAWLKKLVRWPLRSAYTLADMADDALGVLSALGVARAHVVGASMGGMIAQILAARHPERVISLTSIMSDSGRRGLPGPTREARAVLMRPARNARDLDSLVTHMVHTMRVIGSPAIPPPSGCCASGSRAPSSAMSVRAAWRASWWPSRPRATAANCSSRSASVRWSFTARPIRWCRWPAARTRRA
ncbi:alpha/beta fold hydrolase [Massilia violaceinigra]|uniref:alpha/beta fold hydrolase n=1 Tax=Massilia violaceinigra TaxID=2045208 RepID=UPI0026D24D75|nr:alpha/beta fold hydrolase [Massilia violaceinigra]